METRLGNHEEYTVKGGHKHRGRSINWPERSLKGLGLIVKAGSSQMFRGFAETSQSASVKAKLNMQEETRKDTVLRIEFRPVAGTVSIGVWGQSRRVSSD